MKRNLGCLAIFYFGYLLLVPTLGAQERPNREPGSTELSQPLIQPRALRPLNPSPLTALQPAGDNNAGTNLSDTLSSSGKIDSTDLDYLIVVTASKKKEALSVAPLAVSVLTGDDIKRAGATSLVEALRLMPAMLVRETTPGNYIVQIRGFGSGSNGEPTFQLNTSLLVMIDNHIFYNEFQGGIYWETLPVAIDNIERIEVVRGAASVLYGPNAISGVINIITKNREKQKNWFASVYSQGGSFSTGLFNASFGYGGDNFMVRLTGNYDTRNRHHIDYWFLAVPDFFAGQTFGGKAIAGTGDFQPDLSLIPTTRIAGVSDSTAYFPDGAASYRQWAASLQTEYRIGDLTLNADANLTRSRTITMRYNSSLSQPTLLGTDSLQTENVHLRTEWKGLTATVDFNHLEYTTFGIPYLDIGYTTINPIVEYNFDFGGGFEFRPGASVRRTNAEGEAFGGSVSNTLYSAFARAEYAVGNWRFIAGLRGDQFETPNKGFLSPQVILTHKVSRDLFVRASYGRATRSSLLFETFINVLGTPSGPSGFLRSNFLGNKDLRLVVVENIEIGLRRGVTKKISLDIDLFYTSYSPIIVPIITSVRLPSPTSPLTTDFGPISVGTTYRQYGGTLSLYANLDERLKLTASITVQDLTDITTERQVAKTLPDGVVDIESEPIPEKATLRFDIPRVMALLVADYRPLPFLELHLDANFALQQTLTINTFVEPKYLNLPSQVVLNLVAGCEVLPGVKVFLNGRNLLATEQRQFAPTDRLSRMILAGVNAQF